MTLVAMNLDPNPTTEFENACTQLKQTWIAGTMGVRDALAYLEQLTQQATQSNYVANQGRAEHIAGFIHHDMGDIARAIAHYDKAQRYYTRVGNRGLMATIDLNQGECYREKGDFARALVLYQRAFDMGREVNDITTVVYAQINLGWANFGLKEYDTARLAFEAGLAMTEQYRAEVENVDGTQSEVYYGLACVEIEHQNYPQAWQYGLDAIHKGRVSGEMRPLGYAWRVLGDTLTHQSHLSQQADSLLQLPLDPETYYKNAIICFKDISAEVEIARTTFAHAKSLSARGMHVKASPYYREAIIKFTRLGLMQEAMRVAEAQLRPQSH